MIAFIRKWLTSLPVLALLGLVLIAFVVTGVGDPFGGGGSVGGDLARAGDQKVTEADVLARFERVVTDARVQNPGLTQAEAARQGGIEAITEQLAGVAALDEFAAKHGIRISDRAVGGAIGSIAPFQIAGKFDQATYERLLAQQRIREPAFREDVRKDLLRKQLLLPAATGTQVPRGVAAPYTRLLLDIHEGAVATVPPPAVAPPSPAQVAAYYASNKARFMALERRGFRYALIDRAGLGAKAAVTDAEIQADYEKNRESYGAVEQRRLVQLVLPDEVKAGAFVAAVKGGESFPAAAAKATGASASDIALGLLTRDRFAAATTTALAAQVFAAPAGAVIGPVRTDFGWNVVRIDEIVAPQGKSLAVLRPVILAKLTDAKAETALADVVAKVEDGLSGGTSFADAAKEQGLAQLTVAPVAKGGGGPTIAPIAAKAFDLDPADGATVVELGDGRFALIELGQVLPPAAIPLAQVEGAVAAAWTLEARTKAARTVADAVVAETAKGVPFASAVAKRGLQPPQLVRVRRIDVLQRQNVPPAITQFVALGPAKSRILAAPDGTTLILHVDRVTPGDLTVAGPLLEDTRKQLVQVAPDEFAGAFGRAVEREIGIKLNTAAIAATKKRIIGDATPK